MLLAVLLKQEHQQTLLKCSFPGIIIEKNGNYFQITKDKAVVHNMYWVIGQYCFVIVLSCVSSHPSHPRIIIYIYDRKSMLFVLWLILKVEQKQIVWSNIWPRLWSSLDTSWIESLKTSRTLTSLSTKNEEGKSQH